MSSIADRDAPLSLHFRTELLARVMPDLNAGESVSVIGVSGVGKTNLLRFLYRLDVQSAYWQSPAPWIVPIDTNALSLSPAGGGYELVELIIHRLIRECERRGQPAELRADFDRLYAGLVSQPSVTLAVRYLDRICGRLCDDQGIQLVFAFDQFDEIWTNLEARIFLNLRYLRDEYKYRLCFLVMTRDRLERVREQQLGDAAAVEAFWELFDSHVYGLGMYVPRDAEEMLARMARRRGVSLSPDLNRAALALAGGHPALLRAVFWALYDKSGATPTPAELLSISDISRECAKIWADLSPEEQKALRQITSAASGRPTGADSTVGDLMRKELVAGDPPQPFSPIFAAYIERDRSDRPLGITVVPALRQIWVDGNQLETPLSRLEFALLECLARSAGQVVSREVILRTVYPDDALDVNDERLDTLLRRVRDVLGEDARNPRHLFTHRGVGVRLALGRVQE